MRTQKPLTDTTIVRRLYKFFREHKIDYVKEEGFFRLGSAVCTIVNGDMCVYFPQFSRYYAGTIYFKLVYDEPESLYHRFAKRHNHMVKSFPLIHIRPVPDLYIKPAKQVKNAKKSQTPNIPGHFGHPKAIAV